LTAAISVNQLESLTSSQKILASSVKYKGAKVIDSIKDFLSEMNAQKKLTDKILINDRRYVSDGKSLIPIIIIESNSDNSDNRNVEFIITDDEISTSAKQAIQNKLYASVSEFKWSPEVINEKEILSEYSKLNNLSNVSQRVKDMSMNLFQSNKFETL
jgi:hypothetical protein